MNPVEIFLAVLLALMVLANIATLGWLLYEARFKTTARGVSTPVKIATPFTQAAGYATCTTCGRLVARYTVKPEGVICANCQPIP